MKKRRNTGAAMAARLLSFYLRQQERLRSDLHEQGYSLHELPDRFLFSDMEHTFMTHFLVNLQDLTHPNPIPKKKGEKGYSKEVSFIAPIFNRSATAEEADEGVCPVGDQTRLQAAHDAFYKEYAESEKRKSCERKVADVFSYIKEFALSAYNTAEAAVITVSALAESLLLSEPASETEPGQDQSLHTDGHTTTDEAVAHWPNVSETNPYPFGALYAFSSDVKLWVVEGSYEEVRKMSLDEDYVPEPMKAKLFTVPRNHVLFFSQAFIHAGTGYYKNNIRAHVYFDHVKVPRGHDTTNPLVMRYGEVCAARFTIP